MKYRGINPYLPSWEYVPDGEPHVFGDRVYIYGSHDRFGGYAFCLNDYVCWSAPVEDLTDWRYEGVIYTRKEAPHNEDGSHCLYAPDVTQGADGRFYLYYAPDGVCAISVAVCEKPAGKYEYYGDVHYADGTPLGSREGDEYQFDPGVLTEGDTTWLYSGFCPPLLAARNGAQAIGLDKDMLTIIEEPVIVAPSASKARGTSFEGHGFFEAGSIRKINNKYYFIYSSELSHELCYAVSDAPNHPFVYGGTLVDNGDLGISKTARYFTGNNHGSIEKIRGRWYVFYHRHTNSSMYCRQGMMEPIDISADGKIAQAEMTSCGPNGGALPGIGEYPAYAACNLYMTNPSQADVQSGINPFPYITQDGPDIGAENENQDEAYIRNMTSGVVAGFKYFDCKDVKKISVKTRGMCYGGGLELSFEPDGEAIGKIPVYGGNEWSWSTAEIAIPDGVHALYFKMYGYGIFSFAAFRLE